MGNVEFRNEKEYGNSVWNDRNLRLLSLFRYWNQFEYFSPYKYLTDQNWNAVLREMVPKFENVKSEQELHLAMLELVTKTDDSHAGITTGLTNAYFGFYWIAADFRIIDEKAVITSFHDVEKAQKGDLRIGDVIEKVNGRSISEIMKERDRYLPASNPAVKKRRRYAFLNGPDDSAAIVFSRNGQSAEKTVKRYLSNELKDPVKNDPKWKILDGNIGFVDMGTIEIKEVNAMWNALKSTKAIIFDVRNYPKGTIYAVASKLFRRQKFVVFTQPDIDYPGKFYQEKELEIGSKGKDNFVGKIIVLVNEMTQSHAEFTVMGLQSSPNSITIGSQTAGADGNVSGAIFPTGTKSYITGLGVFYPDGTQTQRKGVKIDIEVEPTIIGIAAGRDEVLEKAIKIASE